MTAPTRKQVHEAICDALLASDRSQVAGTDVFAATAAVMALYADSQPKVLWEGQTVGRGYSSSPPSNVHVSLDVPPGTRVVVTEAVDR